MDDLVVGGKFEPVKKHFENGCRRDGGRSCSALIDLEEIENLWKETMAIGKKQIEYRENHGISEDTMDQQLYQWGRRAGSLENRMRDKLRNLIDSGQKYLEGQKSLLRGEN